MDFGDRGFGSVEYRVGAPVRRASAADGSHQEHARGQDDESLRHGFLLQGERIEFPGSLGSAAAGLAGDASSPVPGCLSRSVARGTRVPCGLGDRAWGDRGEPVHVEPSFAGDREGRRVRRHTPLTLSVVQGSAVSPPEGGSCIRPRTRRQTTAERCVTRRVYHPGEGWRRARPSRCRSGGEGMRLTARIVCRGTDLRAQRFDLPSRDRARRRRGAGRRAGSLPRRDTHQAAQVAGLEGDQECVRRAHRTGLRAAARSAARPVKEVVIHRDNGLFPQPGEIKRACDCPDWATMCKHVAAVLYGVGSRLEIGVPTCCSGCAASTRRS